LAVRALWLERRRQLLEEAIAGSDLVLPVRRLELSGARAWETVQRRRLKGFVAKDPRSAYRSGPTRSWVKVEIRYEGVFVVGSLCDIDGARGVLVGERIGGDLCYHGVVEWGVKTADRLELVREADSRPQRVSPFADLSAMRGSGGSEAHRASGLQAAAHVQ
jgi:ATP-dependent DNA ligase